MNKCIFSGNLGRDPEMSYTTSGKANCRFSIGVNRTYKDRNGDFQTETTWVRLTAWEWAAEKVMKNAVSGTQVFVECEFESRKYNDKDGVEREYSGFVVRTIEFGKRAIGSGAPAPEDIPELDPETGNRF